MIAVVVALAGYLHNQVLVVAGLGVIAVGAIALIYWDVAHERRWWPFGRPATSSAPPMFTPEEARQIMQAASIARDVQRRYWLDMARTARVVHHLLGEPQPPRKAPPDQEPRDPSVE